jgi:hypothetical protein
LIENWIDDAAKVRASTERQQKTERQTWFLPEIVHDL